MAKREPGPNRLVPAGWRDATLPFLVIGLGGIVGANIRWKFGEWAADQWSGQLPWGTLLINLSGSFILGLFLVLMVERVPGRPLTRLFGATGLLGAYTTFSTFVYELARLIQHGHLLTATTYVLASLVFGLACAWAGTIAARAV